MGVHGAINFYYSTLIIIAPTRRNRKRNREWKVSRGCSVLVFSNVVWKVTFNVIRLVAMYCFSSFFRACRSLQNKRNTCVILEHHVVVLSINHVNVFYMGLYVSGGSHQKYTYMIDWEYSHVVLQDHARISCKTIVSYL